jgi:type IV pilus assembly protein PilW
MRAFFYTRLRNNSGAMLVELMLACALALVLIGLLLKIYLGSQQSARIQSSLNQIQDNAKIAITILSSEIHQAGYIGCAKLTNDFPLFFTRYELTEKNKIKGDRHSITIRHAAFKSDYLIKDMLSTSILEVKDDIHFKKNNILIISDCKHAEIFQIKNIIYSRGIQIITPISPLHNQFDSRAELARFEVNHFFISRTKRKDFYGNPISALYVKNLQGETTRLVDGINDLNIQYLMGHAGVSGVKINLNVCSARLCKIWHADVSL